MVVSTHSVMPRTEAGSQRSGTGHMSPLNLEESLEISIICKFISQRQELAFPMLVFRGRSEVKLQTLKVVTVKYERALTKLGSLHNEMGLQTVCLNIFWNLGKLS